MYQFFIEPSDVQGGQIVMTGSDVNHIKNVLRMRAGEKIAAVSEAEGKKYLCEIVRLEEEGITCRVLSVEEEDTELPAKIFLFQGLPKGDRMELILMIWGIPWQRMTLPEANRLTIVGSLIQNAVVHANRYLDALTSQRYLEQTNIMSPDAFGQLVRAFFGEDKWPDGMCIA